jgi:hydroxyacylglutathione hydrolase
MPIENPIITEIAKNTFLINEFGMNTMFLLNGTQRSLLIDTGTGVCDLKKIAKSLTNLPLSVALTHGHVDHAGGIGQFDEVYIHKYDIDMALSVTLEARIGYAMTLKKMSGDLFAYGESDVRDFKHIPKFKNLSDGDVIDLGGRSVKVLCLPGHTRGSVCFIDDMSRILFSGDACNVNLLLAFPGVDTQKEPRKTASVSTELRGLLNLNKHRNEFDRNYNGHVGYAFMLNCMPMDDRVLDDCIACCRGVIDGTIKKVRVANAVLGKPGDMAMYGKIRMSYDDRYILEDDEIFK